MLKQTKQKPGRKIQVDKARNLLLLYMPSNFRAPLKSFAGRKTKERVEISDPRTGLTFHGEGEVSNPASKHGYVLIKISEWGVSLTLLQGGFQLKKKVLFREDEEDSAKVIAAQNRKIDFRKTKDQPHDD